LSVDLCLLAGPLQRAFFTFVFRALVVLPSVRAFPFLSFSFFSRSYKQVALFTSIFLTRSCSSPSPKSPHLRQVNQFHWAADPLPYVPCVPQPLFVPPQFPFLLSVAILSSLNITRLKARVLLISSCGSPFSLLSAPSHTVCRTGRVQGHSRFPSFLAFFFAALFTRANNLFPFNFFHALFPVEFFFPRKTGHLTRSLADAVLVVLPRTMTGLHFSFFW